MRSPSCLCVYVSPPYLTSECLNQFFFFKLGMYIMTPESISTAYFINPSHQSVRLYVYPPVVARKWLGKNVIAANEHMQQLRNCWVRRFLYGPCRVKGK
jgi:hypothetical protein